MAGIAGITDPSHVQSVIISAFPIFPLGCQKHTEQEADLASAPVLGIVSLP